MLTPLFKGFELINKYNVSLNDKKGFERYEKNSLWKLTFIIDYYSIRIDTCVYVAVITLCFIKASIRFSTYAILFSCIISHNKNQPKAN